MFVGIKWYRPNNESYEGSDNKDPDVDFEQTIRQSIKERAKKYETWSTNSI